MGNLSGPKAPLSPFLPLPSGPTIGFAASPTHSPFPSRHGPTDRPNRKCGHLNITGVWALVASVCMRLLLITAPPSHAHTGPLPAGPTRQPFPVSLTHGARLSYTSSTRHPLCPHAISDTDRNNLVVFARVSSPTNLDACLVPIK